MKRFHVPNGRYKLSRQSRYMKFSHVKGSIALASEPEHEQAVHGTYGALLFDKRWKEKRLTILKRDGEQCVICKSKEDLQVHHRQYHFIKELNQFKAPWDYEDSLLVTFCEKCHNTGHSKYKVPCIYV